jgi:hypothetical protein
VTNLIVDMHADDPEFGYRFIADELEPDVRPIVAAANGGSVPSSADLVDDGQERPPQFGHDARTGRARQ